MNATGRINALRTVVKSGRTRVISRFLTVNVQICRRKSLIIRVVCKRPQESFPDDRQQRGRS